jgi:C4-dicarboxylate transporter, DctM subunit
MATGILVLSLAVLFVLILLGWHIAIALAISTFLGVYLIFGDTHMVFSLLAGTAFEGLRNYVFAVIPLFVLMGDLIARSGAARDLYRFVDILFRRLPGRLGVATVGGNALFAAVTGVSLASAAAFSRIAYPEMIRLGYSRSNAAAVIAGSACLGMLIPPSVLMIIWGILTQESIGRLFMAGVVPGILLSLLFGTFVVCSALLRPETWGYNKAGKAAADLEEPLDRRSLIGIASILGLIVVVIGGIWGGAFTPTEAAGVGAIGGLVIAIIKRMTWREIGRSIVESGRSAAPIMLLLIVGQLYSRLLAIGGVNTAIQDVFSGSEIGPWLMLGIMILIWLILGMLLDTVSIILLTVPIFAPLAVGVGWDPIAFAIIGILAIEAGLLTPPFGLLVYAVKGFLNDDKITLVQLFGATIPYWIMILIVVVLVALFPGIASWLPSLMLGR